MQVFQFTQEHISGVIADKRAKMSGVIASYTPILPAFLLRSILHLCVSDANKTLLLVNSGEEVCGLLIEAMLLDPEHIRLQPPPDSTIQPITAELKACNVYFSTPLDSYMLYPDHHRVSV